MIEARKLTKHFGRLHAVTNLSLSVPQGQALALLGPNGAGKTTTVRMLTGILPPTQGSASIDSFDTITHAQQARTRLGYLPEHAPLPTEMTVNAYLRFRARLFRLPRRTATSAIDAAIDRCWLTDVRTRPIARLSKGFRQRVSLAAALLHQPPVLILDEPTSGLDPSQIAQTRELIRELAADRTVIIVSHLLAEVERTCQTIAVIAQGHLRALGPPTDLINQTTPNTTLHLQIPPGNHTSAHNALAEALPNLQITSPSQGCLALHNIPATSEHHTRHTIAQTLLAHSIPTLALSADRPSLERAYLTLLEQQDR